MYVLMLCALFGRVVRECGCCIVISTYQHAHAYASLQRVRCYQHAHAYALLQEVRCCEKNSVYRLTLFSSHLHSCVCSFSFSVGGQGWGSSASL